jgi:DNA-binding YbaB/EbfC family protein
MAANAQVELQKVQDNLEHVEVAGQAGGGMVTIRATAKGRILGVEIDPSLLIAEEKETLEDLIVAAINDARTNADRVANDQMQQMTSGLALPPGMKLPF